MTSDYQTANDWRACRRAEQSTWRYKPPEKTRDKARDWERFERDMRESPERGHTSAASCMKQLGYEDLDGFDY